MSEFSLKDTARIVSFNDTKKFERPGFSGYVIVGSEEQMGFNTLLVDVHGSHPKKRILAGNTRAYVVVDGLGTFTINGEQHDVGVGDSLVIESGGEYEYEGQMLLVEFNSSPDNTFGDEVISD